MMDATTVSMVANGRYYWEQLFSYDNSKNTGTITDKTKITTRKTVSSKEFLSNKFNVNTGFSYKNESSVSLKFDGVGDSSQKTEFSYHLDLAYELVKTSETAETIDQESETERNYEVGPGGQLSLYRLCYSNDGVLQKTDTVSTAPNNDILINMNFTGIKRILGLDDILNLFGHTTPGSSNTTEWEAIRNNIVQYTDKTEEEAFRNFVDTLHKTAPRYDNTAEWDAIRATCSELLKDWDDKDKQLLFKKLLARFSATSPSRDNTAEWANIRGLSNQILAGLRQVF